MLGSGWMKRLIIGLALLLVTAGIWWWFRAGSAAPIPPALAAALPSDCSQVVLVLAEDMDRVPAQVWLLERGSAGDAWKVVQGPMEASIGKNGVGWGVGDPVLPNPGIFPDKREGDGRSPAGIFTLSWAFGTRPAVEAPGVKLAWRECTETLRGVDDVNSRYYNQIIDEAAVPDKDWKSAEIMRRPDGLYDEGIAIGHNPANRRGGGSCIFLHIWRGAGSGTAGCTALSRSNVHKILQWVDPSKNPRLILDVKKPEG